MRLTYAPNLFPPDQMAGCAPCAGLGYVYPEECWKPGADCFDPDQEGCPPGYRLLSGEEMMASNPQNEPLPTCVPTAFGQQLAESSAAAKADLIGLGIAVVGLGVVAYLVMR